MLLDYLGPRIVVLADKAHDADRARKLVRRQRRDSKIPPRSNHRRKHCSSKHLYGKHNLIKWLFPERKHFRRVAMVRRASIRLWLRDHEYSA